MKFTAHLITSRELPRPYQTFAPDLVNAEGVAGEYLERSECVPGDKFDLYEIRPVKVSTIEIAGYETDGKTKKFKKIVPGE